MNLSQQHGHQTCIVILGMHRSGTSALAGVLSLLGIYPGNELLPAMEDVNPKGFWEHTEIVSIHNQLLDAFDSSWEDESPLPNQWWDSPRTANFRDRIVSVLRRDFNNQTVWLIKDPRMCRLLPLWQEVFRELGCKPLHVLALRNPAEVASSLLKRNDLAEEASCLLWLTHMLETEYHTRGQSRVLINYEHLLSDWRGTVIDIGKTLGLTWPVAIEDAAHSVEAFLDSSLRHHAKSSSLPDHPACHLAQKCFELLSSQLPNPVELDRLRVQVEELVNLVIPWSKRLRHSERQTRVLEGQNNQLESEKAALHAELKRVKSTFSWQITKPLRFAWNTLLQLLPDNSPRSHINPSAAQHAPSNTNEDEAYTLLLKRFAPIYKDHTNSYIDELLTIDHYRGRLNYLREIIGAEPFHSGARVLVSGYGAGSEMIAARQAGLGEIHGVEVDQIWLEASKKRLASMPGFYPAHYDGMHLPYPDAWFDILLSGHVIEHNMNPKLYLHECMRVLAVGGYLSLEIPDQCHHTDLPTRLPPLERLPRGVKGTALRVLSGRTSPLGAEMKECYTTIASTKLQQISMESMHDWLKSSGYHYIILDTKKAAPDVIRCVVRKAG